MKNNCVFCAITDGEIPSFRIYEDEFVTAFLDINPFEKGHVLVVPRHHCQGIADVPEDILHGTVSAVRRIAVKIVEATGAKGFNILQNNGEVAGQSVMHLHFHIVPRYSACPLGFVNGKASKEELAELAEKLTEVLSK